ncbi:uncharacterized protein si:ch211-286b5.2 isoform X2 [Boleophthalmus pectinirostris]|uniref:uncharacterized protein si:ch211-286b5.2 isoform X2 n=1 Tax=Boleophthalmus pectinirostris TaxID=150288 RepID=UPI0024318E8B|nr:uncharacterized protein si:ch211-286b5.2 isoform X2 [Boleophthalmus pectinirostris]
MAKGKISNRKQDSMDPSMTRTLRSRKRGYPIEKITVDDHHQDLGEANTEETYVQCNQEGDTQYTELNSSAISDEKNGESETPEVNTADLKRQLVINLSNCGHDSNQNKMEEEKIPNECESPASSDYHNDVNAEMKPNGSGEQISVEDNPHQKMETNQELDEIKLISIEQGVEGLAKKRRRLGRGRLSEKEQSLFLRKCANKAESSEKQNEYTMVAEEEKGSVVEALLPHQQTTEMMQQDNLKAESKQNKDEWSGIKVETKVKAAVTEMTMKCEPLTREMHISKADPKGDVHSVITKPHDEKASQRTETEAHLTVSICDALSPNLENYEPTQKPHLDKEQLLNRSETECHYTATLLVADSLCEPQNPELQTTKVQLDSPSGPDPTAELSNTNQKNMMNEQQPLKEIEVTSTDKQHENKHADKDHSHSESCNSKTNPTEKPPIEQELCHQPNTCDKMFLENLYQIIGENSHLIHTSVSDVALETNCNFVDKGHMNSSCAEKEQYDTDTSTENMGPPHSREYVSDSQLNNIDMTDQITDVGTRVSPECYEDVTDLVGGLIRELSSLNRMVMATHRELENLRRRGKTSRNTIR